MGEMSGFDAEMKRLYLAKRKKVGTLATDYWQGRYPKFNTPIMKAELKKFVSQIEPECSIPEIGFTAEGIAQHIQDYFSEQRRYQKKNNGKKDGQVLREDSSVDAEPTVLGDSSNFKPVKRKSPSEPLGKRFRASLTDPVLPCMSTEQDAASNSDSGESLSTLSVDSSDDHHETGISSEGNKSPPKDITVPTTATSSNLVIKAVFGRILSREQTVNILRSKFSVKQSNLTNLTPTQLQQVLIKKLIKNNYVSLKEGKTNPLSKDDVDVHKEIEV